MAATNGTSKRETVGFIGLGVMGHFMARNLLLQYPRPGLTLVVYDADKSCITRFVDEIRQIDEAAASRIVPAGSVSAVAMKASTTVTALPNPKIVLDVVNELSKSLSADPARLILDCSTIDPSTSQECARLLSQDQRGRFIDAPMSGGSMGAAAGTLTFMIGYPPESACTTEQEQFAQTRIMPVLEAMGKKIWRMGEVGNGEAAKLTNNYISAISNIATCEAFNLGIRLGLNPSTIRDVVSSSTGMNWVVQHSPPVAGSIPGKSTSADRDYALGFSNELMKKDVQLAVKAAAGAGARLELGQSVVDVYAKTSSQFPNRDIGVVYKMLNQSIDKE
ncbi:hypothetical protein PV10_00139 [Exophiala mesophila]|uniref:3-hydroxyisobutyrate dehydrogenase n=1 Tax=Exophiala mesophila TaxID=212818 RepID=A0A0D1ZQI3_EXOME|nr:uncharacterized protein PV10_00139 [Exophiala mesophila]KIV96254.1 hypothetical protein PV10_00139 [Exophiala mesophila]